MTQNVTAMVLCRGRRSNVLDASHTQRENEEIFFSFDTCCFFGGILTEHFHAFTFCRSVSRRRNISQQQTLVVVVGICRSSVDTCFCSINDENLPFMPTKRRIYFLLILFGKKNIQISIVCDAVLYEDRPQTIQILFSSIDSLDHCLHSRACLPISRVSMLLFPLLFVSIPSRFGRSRQASSVEHGSRRSRKIHAHPDSCL